MLDTFGDGYTVPCSFCGLELDWFTMTKDRWPLSGADGGHYVRGNVRPACGSCNSADGARRRAAKAKAAKLRRDARNARRRALYALRRDLRA
jgi:hypothetical protein